MFQTGGKVDGDLWVEHKKQELDTFISENYSPDQLSILVNDKRQEFLQQDRWKRLLSLDPDQLTTLAERQVRAEIAQHIHFLQFDEFRRRYLREGNARSETADELKPPNPVKDLIPPSSAHSHT